MAGKTTPKGKLFALEGIRNADLLASGKKVLRRLSNPKDLGGVSVWDASGIFFELGREGGKNGYPSAKTMLMLYASDLAFRLRWEIQPALDSGLTVLAAPYVETAMAAGAAAGISKDWMTELFRFAPEPEAVLRLGEKDVPSYWKAKPSVGFVEFFCAMLGASSDEWEQHELRRCFTRYLDKLEKNRRVERLPDEATAHTGKK